MPYFLSDLRPLSHIFNSYMSNALSDSFLLFLCDLLLQYKLCLFLSLVTCLCLSQLPLTVMPGSLSHVSVSSCKASVPLLCCVKCFFLTLTYSFGLWSFGTAMPYFILWCEQINSVLYSSLFTLTNTWRSKDIARSRFARYLLAGFPKIAELFNWP